MPMQRFLCPLLFLLLPWLVFANGDPVAYYCALTLSKTPVAQAIPEIQIDREDLHIRLEHGRSHILVEYTLHNTSRKHFRNIHYGFPVDWAGGDSLYWKSSFYTEAIYQKGWSDDYVSDFSFRLNGQPLSANRSVDTLIHKGYTSDDWHKQFGYPDWQTFDWDEYDKVTQDTTNKFFDWAQMIKDLEWMGNPEEILVLEDPVHRRWYYTSFSVRPRETVILRVEYTLRHSLMFGFNQIVDEFQRHFDIWRAGEYVEDGYNHFHYDYSPAAAWGNGTAHQLNLTIEAPGMAVWSPVWNGRDSALFRDSYYRQYTHFDYATAEPLQLEYFSSAPDSLDVMAVREHRLAPECYTLRQFSADTSNYGALSDLSGCTGIELVPTDSGNYVLDIWLDRPTLVTGLAIMNGNCCDSLSWASNGHIEQMQIMYWGNPWWSNKEEWIPLYANRQQVHNYVEENYYPAPCKTTPPADFSWDGLVKAAEKVNISPRTPSDAPSWIKEYETSVQHIRITIPPQLQPPYISEVILLYEPHD